MSDYEIKDLSSNHKYRTEIPNIIFEIGLQPKLIGVYAAVKRCAGDNGICIKSEKTLAEQLKVTEKTLRGLIAELCEVNPILGRSVLNCKKRISEHGDRDTTALTITDLWPANYNHFTTNLGGPVKITGRGVKITEGVGQKLPDGPVKITDKEEPLKKNLSKKNPPPSVPKNLGEGEDLKKINDFISECKKKELPFTPDAIFAIFKETSGLAIQNTIHKYLKRSKNLRPLDTPDAWLRKNAIQQHEYLEQTKDYQ